MFPPGHVALGYLVTKGLLAVSKNNLTSAQADHLIWWGLFWSFTPDLDSFISFARSRSFKLTLKFNHRELVTHAPILWLIAGLSVYFFSSSEYFKFFGLIIWLTSWSHFLADSVEQGLIWLWPFSHKRYALMKGIEEDFYVNESTFQYYFKNIKNLYTKSYTFYLEVAVLITAAVFYLVR